MTERKLIRELAWVVALKLVLIVALWAAFIRDARVPVDAGAMAARAHAVSSPATHPTEGENNDF